MYPYQQLQRGPAVPGRSRPRRHSSTSPSRRVGPAVRMGAAVAVLGDAGSQRWRFAAAEGRKRTFEGLLPSSTPPRDPGGVLHQPMGPLGA